MVRKEFENQEKNFINPIRIAFYNIFQNLTSVETKDLMKRNKLEPKNGFKRMETAVLCLSKNINELILLKKIIDDANDNANDKPKIAKLKRDTMILTEDSLELKRGQCLIINQEKYKPPLEERHGSKEDKIYLAKVCLIYTDVVIYSLLLFLTIIKLSHKS